MRAGLRWTMVLLGGALVLLPYSALAQSTASTQTAQPTDTPPASDAIGPRELQNFSLKGSVTKPADQQPAPTITTAPARRATSSVAATPKGPQRRLVQDLSPSRETATARASVSARTTVAQATAPAAPAPVQQSVTPAPAPAPFAATPTPSFPSVPETLAPEHKLSFLPWLIAALALAGGMLFLLWRRRPREALAGGPDLDLFVAPEPAAAPPLTPVPRAAVPRPTTEPPFKPAVHKGIVATRLRPQVEIAVHPMRCLVDGDQVTLEFELELFNAGAAPARAVHAETALFNAGGAQDRELAAFFANPVGAGERLVAIPPMKRVAFASKVVAPRSAIQEYELGGRKTIVPVLAFNTFYEWSGGRAQTSAAYLVGRETRNDKLGPLAVNGAAREFRGLAVHVLPAALKT